MASNVAPRSNVPSFSEATEITPRNSHSYTVNLSKDWCIGNVPHGGYVTSCIQRAVSTHFTLTLASQNQPHCLTLHLEFLRRTSVGHASLTVRDVKLGTRTSTVHVTLSQREHGKEREEVAGYVTHTNLLDPAVSSGLSIPTHWSLDPAPLPAEVSKFATNTDPNYVCMESLSYAEFRKASQRVRFCMPRFGRQISEDRSSQSSTGVAFSDQWLSFNKQAPDGNSEYFTTDSLGFLVDMFPQLIEKVLHPDIYVGPPLDQSSPEYKVWEDIRSKQKASKANHWYPTLHLNLEVKKPLLPSDEVEYLFLRVQSKCIKDGRYDIEMVVLDPSGDLVCLSQHVCFILSASRNLAGKDEGKMAKEKL
ncbi:MAG: hypothetical protein M1831_003842 [Alyxoria varia]|nr:MAG: hypothetical protein M1831_003842 [Alyxoria varia]